MLALDEQRRAGRFRFERDRNRFIARRGLLRMILVRYLGLDSESLRFCYGPNGKPSLEPECNPGELSFNMSHSDGLAIYAINRKRKIGVDVERVRPVPENDKIVEDVFPSTKQARLPARHPDQRAEAFLGWWTRNEACVKASGDGLCRWMDSIDDSARDGQPSRSNAADSDSEEPVGWSFQTLVPAPGYTASVVVEGADCRLACWRVPDEMELAGSPVKRGAQESCRSCYMPPQKQSEPVFIDSQSL
jgi:4'-phosphopantetheinyl transferase